jgi:hypothetical protein
MVSPEDPVIRVKEVGYSSSAPLERLSTDETGSDEAL